MSADRLTRSDKRALVLWVLVGLAGAFFAHKYFFRAFPEASVNFRVSREEALTRARHFLTALGENITGYQSAIVFRYDENAKTYLERQLGLQQANRLMSSELNIWYWDARFFRPGQEEEFHVSVSPSGKIVDYDHHVEEARAGASPDRTTAQNAALDFLRKKLDLDLSSWDFLPEEANPEKKPNRLDWSFTWEKHGFRAKDAPYRLQVTLHGDRIGSEGEFLQVPEAWQRSFEQLRSANIFYNQIAIIPYVLLLGAALWMGILLSKRGQTTWGGAIKLGILVAILLFLMQLNQWPLERANYDTNSSYGSFIFEQIIQALLFGLGSALTISLVLPGAEPLYRASQPNRLRLAKAFTLRGLRSKEFFSSSIVGLSLAGAHIGFIVAFYIVASHYGAWAPQEVSYENSVSTAFPWISGVAIGLLASTSEEFLFRLFAIPFLQRVTRSRILAVVLPAFSWSFLHSAYPNEPPYIRGIEVGLIGIVAGIVMLRWGILATLIWHYTVDASLVGLLLVRSNSLYFKISGLIVAAAALAPLLFAAVAYLARCRFEPDEDLLNGAEPAPDLSLTSAQVGIGPPPAKRTYDALSPATSLFLAACLIFGGVTAWRFKPRSIGDYLKLSVDAREARARADEVIRRLGINSESYRHAAVLVDTTDPVTNEFLRERMGISGLNAIYANQVPGDLWLVRYFREGQAEEYSVVLKPDGSLHSIHHKLAEATEGASLGKDEAETLANKYLREDKNLDLSGWSLVDSQSKKQPHRIDHTFTWQQHVPLDTASAKDADSTDHAYARMELRILGNEPADYRTYIKIPDEWRRQRETSTLFRTLYAWGIPILLFGGFGITALVLFLKKLRSEEAQAIPWRHLALWAAWGLFSFCLSFGLSRYLPYVLSTYDTAIPYKTVIGGVVIGGLLGALLYFGALALLFGIAWYYGYRAFGEERLPVGGSLPAVYYRDALWIGIGGTAALLGLKRAIGALSPYWPTVHRAIDSSFGQNLDATIPAASILGSALLRGLFFAGLIALIATFFAAVLRPRWLRFLFFLLCVLLLVGSSWGNPADFAKQFIAKAIFVSVLIFGVCRVTRFNILGCFLVAVCTSAVGGAAGLLSQPDSFYRANGYAVLVALVLLLAWPFSAWRMRASAAG